MKFKFFLIVSIVFQLFFTSKAFSKSSQCSGGEILNALYELSYENGGDKSISVSLAKELAVKVEMQVTSKGNGGISILGLKLRLFDEHDDGRYYKDSALDICLVDLNADGIKDILIHGVAIHTGEVPTAPSEEENVLFVFEYSKNSNTYRKLVQSATFGLEIR